MAYKGKYLFLSNVLPQGTLRNSIFFQQRSPVGEVAGKEENSYNNSYHPSGVLQSIDVNSFL